MAFPTTITSATAAIGCGGPFVSSGGNVYVFTPDNAKLNLRALKATDPSVGFTSAGSDVVVGSGADILVSVAAFQVGDTVHVATKDGNGSNPVNYRYHIFSMASDSWTTTNEAIRTGLTTKAGGAGQACTVDIGVRSSGDVIVMYNGNAGSFSGIAQERLFYARRTAGTWTADIALDNGGQADWITGCLVMGANDRTHFFFQDWTNHAGYQRTLTSANSLEAMPASFDTTIFAFNESMQVRGTAYSSGANTVVNAAFYDASRNMGNVNFNSVDAPTQSASFTTTSPTSALNPTINYASYAHDGTTLWNVFVDTSNDLYTQPRLSGTAWTAPSLFYAGTVTNVYTNVYTRNTALVVGIVFHETSPKYSEFTLSAIASTLRFGMGMLGVGR